jgi:hypothetical protein
LVDVEEGSCVIPSQVIKFTKCSKFNRDSRTGMRNKLQALAIHASPDVHEHIAKHGLAATDITTVAATATGLPGLILGSLDRFVFGQWLASSQQCVDLVASSFGSLRMAAACCPNPAGKLKFLEDAFIHNVLESGHDGWSAHAVAQQFLQGIQAVYQPDASAIIQHARYRLHTICSRGVGALHTNRPWRMALGFSAACLANGLSRQALGKFVERAVFSNMPASLPFHTHDIATQTMPLMPNNLCQVLLASCSIPFALPPVEHIDAALPGPYWDGGITDCDLALRYKNPSGFVLMLHLNNNLMPGWLDAPLRWRHNPLHAQQRTIILSPKADWIKTLPRGKLPDRSDFHFHGSDTASRLAQWKQCLQESQQLAQDFQDWLDQPDPQPLFQLGAE